MLKPSSAASTNESHFIPSKIFDSVSADLAERITTAIFKQAQEEGPSSVSALRELLTLNEALTTNREARPSTADFDDTRLLLLTELADSLERPGIKSVQSLAHDYERITDKDAMVLSFGKIRHFSPKEADLRATAEARGIDGDRITSKLFEIAVKEGDRGSAALRELLSFDDGFFDNETKGSTEVGRMEARVTLLEALARRMDETPQPSMESACRNVELEYDKVFLAQSYQYANITHLVDALQTRADERGRTALRLAQSRHAHRHGRTFGL